MAKLKEFNGKFCESQYESVFIEMLQKKAGWKNYSCGNTLKRKATDVLIKEDFFSFMQKTAPELTENEIEQIFSTIALAGGESHFATLHKIYDWMSGGLQFTPEGGVAQILDLIDFKNVDNNIFRVVNQLKVEYKNQGQKEVRIPDLLLYVNGLPLCIIELKNPADENATIHDAWKQITKRYWRDIPHLLHFCPLSCISDGVKTRLGTVRTPYEHYYAWRRVNDSDPVSNAPFDELECMIKGVYAPKRFLEIFRDYILFQDSNFDAGEKEIVCRYPQFFATRLLKKSIVEAVQKKCGKGGTYFGATGCGKTYTMAFLARQLALRCSQFEGMGSPTVVLIVDREDLQTQSAQLFTRAKDFLNLGEVSIVKSRDELRCELGSRESGGFYICTIQKFCDREGDKIGLVNNRANIICFSDEAHRTQIERAKKIKFSKDADDNMRAMLSKPYAKVLREALPHATFVGFTGTPIDESYQTFGDEIDRYTMDQAVADGLTVPIKYHPRIARVLLQGEQAKQIEEYYRNCAEDGATAQDIARSKKSMSSMEVILGDDSRLSRLATDIHNHYEACVSQDPHRTQKAMIVCSSRNIAFSLLKHFKKQFPEWFEEKKTPDGVEVTKEELATLEEMPKIAFVASVSKNDEEEMYNYLGGVKCDARNKKLDAAFKNDKSNFQVVIVVDMWVTGFDAPSLTYMYNDKPLKKHMLVQTISRVNRVYPGKDYGLIVDYIGIRDNMRQAMAMYGGDNSVALSKDDTKAAFKIFYELLGVLKDLFKGFDLKPFLDTKTDDYERYRQLAGAAEFVFSNTQMFKAGEKTSSKTITFKSYFLGYTKRLKKAYDICFPTGDLAESDSALAQCFIAIAGFVRKMSIGEHDEFSMNAAVEKMVHEALRYNKVEDVFETSDVESVVGPDSTVFCGDVKMPAAKLELLLKLLKRQIGEYGKYNKLAAKKFQDMLQKTVEEYNERRSKLDVQEAGEVQEDAATRIILDATEQAHIILQALDENKQSFRKLGLSFVEKAFYDILVEMRDEHNFEFGEDVEVDGVVVNEKCKQLAQKIKNLIDSKSEYADWLNNRNIRQQLKLDIKMCLVENGYPPQYSPQVFNQVMDQVENLEENTTE